MEELYQESSHVNLLVALLLRFPLLSRVQYHPDDHQVKLVIFLKELTEDKLQELRNIINEHLDAHNKLLYRPSDPVKVVKDYEIDFVSISITHKLNLAFCEEITIILELINKYLASVIITEGDHFLDELLVSKEDLEEIITQAGSETNKLKLTGLRSDGKVLVYSDRDQNQSS